MSDIEAQLKGLSIQVETPPKKENECLYLCSQCKWNILLLCMSGGGIVITLINITTITSNSINRLVTQYLIVNVVFETITWVSYLHYYIINNTYSLTLAKVFYLILNSVQTWGVLLLLDTTTKQITNTIGINIILTVWYIYLVGMLPMNS